MNIRLIAGFLLSLCFSLSLSLPLAATEASPVKPVAGGIDFDRYAGRWYEIARLPMYFERRCASDITARYEWNADGSIAVRNSCKDENGKRDEAYGVARLADSQNTAKIEVRFAPDWLSWLSPVWADYWVLDVSPNYKWALVGQPSRKYLWVLSREPNLPKATFDKLKAEAEGMGYQLDSLIVSGHIDPS